MEEDYEFQQEFLPIFQFAPLSAAEQSAQIDGMALAIRRARQAQGAFAWPVKKRKAKAGPSPLRKVTYAKGGRFKKSKRSKKSKRRTMRR